jgi:DNA-binding CsgD family transcriptional regulator
VQSPTPGPASPPLRRDNGAVAFPPHSLSPTELAALLEAERQSIAFLAYRDGAGEFRLCPLEDLEQLTIGRADESDLVLGWDAEVSRAHARLERAGGGWTLVDDGLSRNGSFVNGERVLGRKRLRDGDSLRFGDSAMLFRSAGPRTDSTVVSSAAAVVRLSEAERRVLVALCRPLITPSSAATPASNKEIAEELSLSLDGVKTQVRVLFGKLEVGDLPQNRKRAELANRAVQSGLVSARDLSK